MPRFTDLETERPNVLFIMADQLRHEWLGYAGAGFVSTPNLDALAATGMVFTNCFTNNPVCAPARISLATGLNPWRTGALDNGSFLPFGARTYYQQLRDHGYRVGCVGKLDLAKPDGYNSPTGDRPCTYSWGFTDPCECEGKMHAGRQRGATGPYSTYLESRGLLDAFCDDYDKRLGAPRVPEDYARDSVLPTEAFEDCYIGDRAAEWVASAPADYPWHYFVSFVGPHDPFDPPTEYADLYRDCAMPDAITAETDGRPRWHAGRTRAYTPEQVQLYRRQYAAAIHAIDVGVGKIMRALDERGLREKTYVVFSADHGEMLCDHGMLTKCTAYDGSWRVPLFVSGPGIGAGRSDVLVELSDVNPTICELAGVPRIENMDARSFAPVARGEREVHREDVLGVQPHWRALRTAEWKYVQNYNDAPELYAVADGPDEVKNLAGDHGDTCRRLRARMSERLMEGGCLRG